MIMEYNHLHHNCMNASDCGAFHTGRDWSTVSFKYIIYIEGDSLFPSKRRDENILQIYTRKTIDAKHQRAPFNSLCMCYMLDNKK